MFLRFFCIVFCNGLVLNKFKFGKVFIFDGVIKLVIDLENDMENNLE